MQQRSAIRTLAVALTAVALSLFFLIEFGVIERVSHAVEKGRLRAVREAIPDGDSPSASAQAARRAVEVVAPAVVTIEADFRPAEPALTLGDIIAALTDKFSDAQEAQPRTDPPGNDSQAPTDSSSRQQQPEERYGVGAGFIFDAEKGYILTNAHVVDSATQIRVRTADGRETIARAVGSAQQADLAVLQIDLPNLHEITFGDSDTISVGDDVFAVGSPFGLTGTVTKGIISAVNRRDVQIGDSVYESLIQTDAVIGPGNSGGPLVNSRGQVIGISSAMASESGRYDGVGFAIPSASARKILDDLTGTGPGAIGIWVGTASDPYWKPHTTTLGWNKNYGALVTDVIPGQAADKAGVVVGDIILAVGATRIETNGQLSALVGSAQPGHVLNVDLWRRDEQITIPVRVGRRYAPR